MSPEQSQQTGNAIYAGRINPDTTEEVPRVREWVYSPNAPAPIVTDNIIRPISIRQLSHGYVIEVGCQTFAIESASTLIAKLSEYILNPLATEVKHKDGKLF